MLRPMPSDFSSSTLLTSLPVFLCPGLELLHLQLFGASVEREQPLTMWARAVESELIS